ncbi:MAG: TldD/PmbA family protein [Myxococcales bacterium]|nr:TldD/PmbA family protein [Myxococcales bacterium]
MEGAGGREGWRLQREGGNGTGRGRGRGRGRERERELTENGNGNGNGDGDGNGKERQRTATGTLTSFTASAELSRREPRTTGTNESGTGCGTVYCRHVRELLLEAVARAGRSGARLAEARFVDDERESIAVRDGRIEKVARRRGEGVGIRVLVDGAWGFAARPGRDPGAIAAAVDEAITVARAAATLVRRRVELTEEEPQRGRFATPVAEDPFTLATDEKVALLLLAEDALRRAAGPAHRTSQTHAAARRQRKALATSEGTYIEQTLAHCGGGMRLVVSDSDGQQHRAYPLDLDGGVAAGGFEVVRRLDLAATAPRIADEARALLVAPTCPAGRRALILDPAQLALQIHESCGHPTECDRAFGEEISLAGASFLLPSRLGRYRYGSTKVNLTADAMTPGGLGTFGWDDEGVAARRTPLIARGQHVGYLTSRETAARLGLPRSGGTMRAETWSAQPIIRMVNVSLEPDPAGPTLEELIADTDDGVYMETNRSWSIDDLRLNFQFGCELAWEVKGGRRTRLLKNPLYTGTTPRFWAGCDAVGRASESKLFGFVSCGKGDPMQIMAVGHGCPPARFRDVEIGSR